MPDNRSRTPVGGVPHVRDDDDADKTPRVPLGIDDPVARAELQKLWHEVHDLRANEIKEIRSKIHDFRNQLAVHFEQDKSGFERSEETMERMEKSLDSVKSEMKSGNDKRAGRLFGLIGAALAIVMAAVGGWIAMRQDITDLRARQDAAKQSVDERFDGQDKRLDTIDKSLDKVDDKLDRMLQRTNP